MSTWWKRIRTIRDAPSYAEGLAFGAACIAFVLLVWWLLTLGEGDARIVDAYTLPSPRETFESFPDLWQRELSRSILISLVRVLGGFLLAAAIGVPLGVAAGSYPRVNAFFKPLVIFGRSIPIAALIPLTMVWFGLGEFNNLMRDDTARTLGAELSSSGAWIRFACGFVLGFALWFPIAGHQVLRKVILPLALPDIVNSLRLIFGLAFGYIMLAEVINAKTGIGALIINSQRRGFQEHIYLCLFIITLLAWGIDRSIMLLQRQLFPHIKHGEN
jgi:NitT/TauT family transport system permease protein